MLKFLSDENFNGDLLRALRLRHADSDVLRVQDAGLTGSDDSAILDWAAINVRVVLTHDRATMPMFAFRRVQAGERMPGKIVGGDRAALSVAIHELLLVIECGEPADLDGRVLFLPL